MGDMGGYGNADRKHEKHPEGPLLLKDNENRGASLK